METPRLIGADGTLLRDLRCVECTYNLRGLNDSGLCPECGALIRESVAAFGSGVLCGRAARLAVWAPAGLSVVMVGILAVAWFMPASLAKPIMVTGMAVQVAALLVSVASRARVNVPAGGVTSFWPMVVAGASLGVSCVLFVYLWA